MTEGRQPFTAEIKTLAKGPSTYDPLENETDVPDRGLRRKPIVTRAMSVTAGEFNRQTFAIF